MASFVAHLLTGNRSLHGVPAIQDADLSPPAFLSYKYALRFLFTCAAGSRRWGLWLRPEERPTATSRLRSAKPSWATNSRIPPPPTPAHTSRHSSPSDSFGSGTPSHSLQLVSPPPKPRPPSRDWTPSPPHYQPSSRTFPLPQPHTLPRYPPFLPSFYPPPFLPFSLLVCLATYACPRW